MNKFHLLLLRSSRAGMDLTAATAIALFLAIEIGMSQHKQTSRY